MNPIQPANDKPVETSPFAVGDSSHPPASFTQVDPNPDVPQTTGAVPESPPTKGEVNTPNIDLKASPLITPPQSGGKKFGTGKIIATIFGLLLLVGGVGAGVILVQQQQNLREKASENCKPVDDYYLEILAHNKNSEDGRRHPEPKAWIKGRVVNNCDQDITLYRFKGWCNGIDKSRDDYWGFCGDNAVEDPRQTIKANSVADFYVEQLVGNTGTCGSAQVDVQFVFEQPPTDPAQNVYKKTIFGEAAFAENECVQASAQCINIVAYDPSWNLLDSTKLAALKPGDEVRFAVSGIGTGVTIDKARFIINGAPAVESTTLKPDSTQYYYQYTIPATAGIQNITVSAQLHLKETDQWF